MSSSSKLVTANKSGSLLARTICIHNWLSMDFGLTHEEKCDRDRAATAAVAEHGLDNIALIEAWWANTPDREALVDATDSYPLTPDHDPAANLDRYSRFISAACIILGIAVGMGTTRVALHYDGSYPINLFAVLAILVALPLLLLLLSCLTALLSRPLMAFRKPTDNQWMRVSQRWILGWIDHRARTRFESALGHGTPYSKVAFWLLTKYAQWFAIGFFGAALVVIWILVTVSDLAFGWSSTLEIKPDTVHDLFSFLSWPWQAALPQAAPTLHLVESSQYFRLTIAPSNTDPSLLGQWWPFVFMSVLVWGLIPRLLLGLLTVARLKSTTEQLLLQNADVVALLDRIKSPPLVYASTHKNEPPAPTDNTPNPWASGGFDDALHLSWNGADRDGTVTDFHAAQTEEERSTAFANLEGNFDKILIKAKGWEPPVLDFFDFLQALADSQPKCTLAILPLPIPGEKLQEMDAAVWRDALQRSGLPNSYIVQL